MRALFYDGQSVKFKPYYQDPKADAAEAIVQVQKAGVCQTDLEIARGYMNFTGVLGHEFVGTVTQCHDSRMVGKRVCGEINCVCGKCDMCQSGLSNHCRNRTVIGIDRHDGAFADFIAMPIRNLIEVPANIADEEAVFIEPLAAACQILRQMQISPRDKVTVLGDGRLGQLCAQVIKQTKCELTLIGRHENKLALAERVGIRTMMDKQAQPRRDQDVVIECTGRAEGFERALAFLRPRGTLVLKTTVAAGKPLNLAPVVIDEITVLGSRCGPFREAIALLAQKKVDVTSLISRRIKLEAAEALFANPTLPPDVMKVVLSFDR